ncbi:hypothetical protein MY11210_006600 [Beauveria gryllotalpidicola]
MLYKYIYDSPSYFTAKHIAPIDHVAYFL